MHSAGASRIVSPPPFSFARAPDAPELLLHLLSRRYRKAWVEREGWTGDAVGDSEWLDVGLMIGNIDFIETLDGIVCVAVKVLL